MQNLSDMAGTKLGKYETYFHINYKNHEKKNRLLLVFLSQDLLPN